jgi:HEAT repeat protein
MDPRVALQETVESLSKLQPGNVALSALEAALPDLSAEQAAKMLSVLSAQLTDTATHQATTAPSTAGVVSPITQGLIDTVLERDSRVCAIQKLGEIKDPAAVPALLHALKDEDVSVRWKAADALVSIGKTAVPALIEALKDKDSEVRREAAAALGKIKDPQAAPALCEALKDENVSVRWKAADALVSIGKTAVPALKEAMEPRGLLERLGFDLTGRRERLRDVIQSIDESKKLLSPVSMTERASRVR